MKVHLLHVVAMFLFSDGDILIHCKTTNTLCDLILKCYLIIRCDQVDNSLLTLSLVQTAAGDPNQHAQILSEMSCLGHF